VSSSFAWLDYSERERRRAMDLIELFRDKTTRDELGLGTIRDAIADTLFPGTSTIQTRARYFLFVPWVYRELEKRQVPSGDIARVARQVEIRLIDALARSDDTRGVIGIEARASLQRLPSSVYWQGLGDWGIRQMRLSISAYHRYFTRLADISRRWGSLEEEDLAADSGVRPMWHSGLPSAPSGFPDEATMTLTAVEADYLRERILTKASGTMLAAMLSQKPPSNDESMFPWEYSQVEHLPIANRIQLDHGRLFALATAGAPLIYNLLLAEIRNLESKRDEFLGRFRDWAHQDITPIAARLRSWDRAAFWQLIRLQYPRLGLPTRRFTDQWIDLVLSAPSVEKLATDESARRLVRSRELALKGRLSRFENQKTLDLWNGDTGTGISNYRWPRVVDIVRDIMEVDGNA